MKYLLILLLLTTNCYAFMPASEAHKLSDTGAVEQAKKNKIEDEKCYKYSETLIEESIDEAAKTGQTHVDSLVNCSIAIVDRIASDLKNDGYRVEESASAMLSTLGVGW